MRRFVLAALSLSMMFGSGCSSSTSSGPDTQTDNSSDAAAEAVRQDSVPDSASDTQQEVTPVDAPVADGALDLPLDIAQQELAEDGLSDTAQDGALGDNDLPAAGPDTEPPVWGLCALLHAGNIGPYQVQLYWNDDCSRFGDPAVDNVAVTQFAIYQDGGIVGFVDTDQHVFSPKGIQPDTVYKFQVQAGDAAGNWSTDGPMVEVKTECPTYWEDKCPVSWPEDAVLTATTTGTGDIKLTWTPAQDNQEVTFYRVLQDGDCLCIDIGVPESNYTVDGAVTEYTVTDLSPGNTYHFQIQARDSVGIKNGGGGWIPGPETDAAL